MHDISGKTGYNDLYSDILYAGGSRFEKTQ